MSVLAGILLMASLGALERPTVTFYVSPHGNDAAKGTKTSPVKTIARAVELTRGVMSDAKREIVVGDGEYELAEPVWLGSDDCDLTIQAQHPGKAVVTGMARLKGWRRDTQDERFLVADLPFEPENGMAYMLTCDGRDCPIAVWPEKGRMKYEGKIDRFEIAYATNAFPAGFDLSAIDLTSVWLELPQEWATTHTLIATNDVASRRFALKTKAAYSFSQFNQGFMMFNARVGLTQPGQWMYETAKKRVVYWPKEGERAERIDCRLTRTKSVFACKSVRGLTLRGLVIEGCARSFVRTNPYDDKAPLGAVVLGGGCEDCTVEDCEIRLSASAGLHAVKPVRCLVKNCRIHDIGGGGINYFDGGDRAAMKVLFDAPPTVPAKPVTPLGKEWRDVFLPDLSNAETEPGVWTRDAEGCLVPVKDKPLLTKDWYERFELEVVYAMGEKGNSGCYIYNTEHPRAKIEIQMQDDQNPDVAKGQNPYQLSGAIYGHQAAFAKMAKKAGEWNVMRIIADGKRVRVVLNDVETAHADLSTFTSDTENPEGSAVPPYMLGQVPLARIPTCGRVGFQGLHIGGAASVRIKSMRIRGL